MAVRRACESGGKPGAEDVGHEDRLADGAPAAAATEAPERILQAPSLRFRHCKWKMILFD